MKKTIRLTESDLTRLVKRILSEVAEEPIATKDNKIFGTFLFPEGPFPPTSLHGLPITKDAVENIKNQIANYIKASGGVEAITRFRTDKSHPLPRFIKISVGTSHTGKDAMNADTVGPYRANYLKSIVKGALDKLGFKDDVIAQITTTNLDASYTPSELDRNNFDPTKIKPNARERFGYIEVQKLEVRGLNTSSIQDVQRGLNRAEGFFKSWIVDSTDYVSIAKNIYKLKTYSDIVDLSNAINAAGKYNSLADFLTQQLDRYPKTRANVVAWLDKISQDSKKSPDTVRDVNGTVSISMQR
jgi:hypothetical protein